MFTVPADLPRLTIAQGWHVRHDADPAHHWLRGEVRKALAGVGS